MRNSVLSLLALAAAATSASATTIYVDNFSVSQYVAVTGAKNVAVTDTTSVSSGTIFGGYRTLSLTSNKNGTIGTPSASLTVGSGSIALSSVNSASTDTIIKWAGPAGTGITGGVDILFGGTTASSYLTFSFVDSNKGASIDWIVTDTNGNTATKSYNFAANITNATTTDALSTFSGTIDWTNVASIALVDHGGGGYNIKYQNILLSSTSTPGTPSAPTLLTNPPAPPVPEPSTYGLALGGLALAGALIRRRAKRA